MFAATLLLAFLAAVTTENVRNLKLLWKQDLGEPLTAPVILGPIFTHRGIKELVLVEGASGEIHAIDADLGRTFWKRRLASGPPCPVMPAAPVITGELRAPVRPVLFTAPDGMVHKINPSTGEDMEAPTGGCGQTANTALAPVIENGLRFELSTRGTVQLNALDAKTGNYLYSSGETLAPADRVSSLALANGHFCFTTSANVLYCFGLPIEI
jgi:outer membrane protein assembly factor BamB